VPAITIGEHLVSDPEVCHGRVTFRGTRITVDAALVMLSQGYTVNQLLEGWPELTRAGVEEAVALPTRTVRQCLT
jgi:uncharacterized protein (DUF433 family)